LGFWGFGVSGFLFHHGVLGLGVLWSLAKEESGIKQNKILIINFD
jgi:asparagine N-glycosylation enzyme membrane subunit Stt3